MADKENKFDPDTLAEILDDSDFIFRIGKKKKSYSEKLQLLILKLLILLWEQEETEVLEVMEDELSLVDDIRHELTFLRAKLYKKILEKKVGLIF